eukprot:TRINITY_DN7588_c0_g1_i1.p1 TRINITY_DN7588_c0_g1~~TRINITY_DN7588_c0_g1_i1.p1  ORF type:complete len:290 (-),score=77.11 TRINITY_DN7588_c0_g1_i1:126-995(-)
MSSVSANTSWTSTSSSSASSSASTTSTEHKLWSNFTFYCMRKKDPLSLVQYEKLVEKLITVHTVEEFWKAHTHLHRNLPNSTSLHLFREGIFPVWEDAANRNGGKWVLRLKKGIAARLWEELVIAMIGDTMGLNEEICGMVMSVKPNENVISIWNRTSSSKDVVLRIRETLKRLLNIMDNGAWEYKPHQTFSPVKDMSTVRHTDSSTSSSASSASVSSSSSSASPSSSSSPSSVSSSSTTSTTTSESASTTATSPSSSSSPESKSATTATTASTTTSSEKTLPSSSSNS